MTRILSALFALAFAALPLSASGAETTEREYARAAIGAFLDACVDTRATQKSVEAAAEEHGVSLGPTEDASAPALSFERAARGGVIQTLAGPKYWSCTVTWKGKYLDDAAAPAFSRLKSQGFVLIGSQERKEGRTKAILSRYSAADRVYDFAVAENKPRGKDATTVMAMIARPAP